MKFLFNAVIIGAAIFFYDFSIAGENIKKNDFENISLRSTGDKCNLLLRKKCFEEQKKKKNKNSEIRYLFLRSSSFAIEEGSGVALVTQPVNIQGIRTIVQALEYPYDSARSKASVSLDIPEGYIKRSISIISILFRTPSTIEKIKGNVTFSIVANINHRDGSSSTIKLGEKTMKHVKTCNLSRSDESRGKPYIIKLRTSHLFSKGDTVNLVLKRINSKRNNFKSSVYIPSLVFAYNIE